MQTSSSILSTLGLLSTLEEIGIVGMIGDSIGSVELLLVWDWLGDDDTSLPACGLWVAGFGVAGWLDVSLSVSSSSEDIVTVSEK